jgi:L-ascorbate 6-phosphate lactonase
LKRKINLLNICWLGQSGYLIDFTDGIKVLIDPYLSDYIENASRGTPYEHVRLIDPPYKIEEIKDIDLILCTHDHPDHLDPIAIPEIMKRLEDVKLILPFAAEETAIKLNLPLNRIIFLDGDKNNYYSDQGLSITALPGKHESFDYGKKGYPYLGYILKANNYSLYHAGDTLLYDELFNILAFHSPDILILPINGRDERRSQLGFAGNMNYKEAGQLAARLKPKMLIPAHYGMFAINTEDINKFKVYMEECYPEVRFKILEIGKPLSFQGVD